MNSLVQRLTEGSHHLVYSRAKTASDLKNAIDRKYVLLKFTETQGGTELGMPLDLKACQLHDADFETGKGSIHLEGQLSLNYVSVRMIADLDLTTLEGKGHLRVVKDIGNDSPAVV